MNPPASIQTTQIVRYDAGAWVETEDELAVEEPLEIRVEGQSMAVVMRTPGHDRELAAGFLFTEGIVSSARDIFDITACVPTDDGQTKGNVVDVGLTRPGSVDLAKLSRHVFTSSSCGICSKTSIAAVMQQRPPLPSPARLSAELILSLPGVLAREQANFQRTGGLHACALFSATGELLEVREDVGRHNALDKLIGWALLSRQLPLSEAVLLLSGRASFEMVQKAHAAGIGVLAAISAPSSLAVELAREAGMTLLGFVRGDRLNVYAGALGSGPSAD